MKVHTKIAEGKANITITVDEDFRAYLKYRADRLGWSLTQFTEPIIKAWLQAGCPPIGEVDKAIPRLSYDEWKKQPRVDQQGK